MRTRLQILLRLFYETVYDHSEEWGAFLDVKEWGGISHPEKYLELVPLYDEIYRKGDREYWAELDSEMREYCMQNDLEYLRNDDTMKKPFEAKPAVVNFFYHEEIKNSAQRGMCSKNLIE